MPAQVIDIGEWKKKNLPQPEQPPQSQVVLFSGDPALQGNDMSDLVRSLFKNQPTTQLPTKG